MFNNIPVLNLENEAIIRSLHEYRMRWRDQIDTLRPWIFAPCRVKILLVTDGGLDFSNDGFGLATLLTILNTPPGPYVRFALTVGHRDPNATNDQVAVGNPHVQRSIKGFRFDDPAHFTPTLYDEVWLFGFDASFPTRNPPGPTDWSNRPTEAELRALSEFMDHGGGVFATGDHGGLGSALCGHIPRVRTMRHWFAMPGPFGNPAAPDMNSSTRNDTNRPGSNSVFEFDDQSDDIPQQITPRYYTRFMPFWKRARWPHPLLCGPRGVITVLPDHPHEGECVLPYERSRAFTFNGYNITEYPNTPDGVQVLPEVIAFSNVLPGNNVKDPTVAQSFGAISAYDGSHAEVGRVVTDATWHHFININLVGVSGSMDPVKAHGFMATLQGQNYLEEIKAYFRNIAIWLAPRAKQTCMRKHVTWYLIWDHQLLEAVTAGTPVHLDSATITDILAVGRHARDALGKFAGQCQSEQWVLDWFKPFLPKKIYDVLNPWPIPCIDIDPRFPCPEPDPIPWFDPEPVLDLALGGGIIALREVFAKPEPAIVEKAEATLNQIIMVGAAKALAKSRESIAVSVRGLGILDSHLKRGLKEPRRNKPAGKKRKSRKKLSSD